CCRSRARRRRSSGPSAAPSARAASSRCGASPRRPTSPTTRTTNTSARRRSGARTSCARSSSPSELRSARGSLRSPAMADIARTVDAVWRIEGARVVATLARMTGDVGLAEDLAQEAVVDALAQWPTAGTPANPGAWLTTVARRKAIDSWRRRERLDERYLALARDLEDATEDEWQPIADDVLRLVFTACHPVLSRESQVALTLRVVSGLTTEEIARLLPVPVPTLQARITRAKKTLTAARVPFEAPAPSEWSTRLGAVRGVVYLLYTEGYAATSGERWVRPELAAEALRLGRVLAGLLPREPETHGLVALMEIQASRFAART